MSALLPRDNLPIDGERLWGDLMTLATYTEPDRPYTRRSFSQTFVEGRAWLADRFREAGLAVRIDAGGNLIGRLEGSDPGAGTIAMGSHSDTVLDGGRFDGAAGVIAALEVARSLAERGIRLRHSIEVVDCLAEEVSEFGLSCIGSRAVAGALTEPLLSRRKADGEMLSAAIARMGGAPEAIENARRDDIRAWLELHIEQGRVLETAEQDLGIVSSVVGITRVEVVIEGQPDHAGTTGMADRHDALVTAAGIVLAVRKMAEARAAAGAGHFVATVGEIAIEPNAANVIPGKARLLIEIRSISQAVTDAFVADLGSTTQSLAAEGGTKLAAFEILSTGAPVDFDPTLVDLMRDTATEAGLRARDMASGAGHDAVFFARVAPAVMIFVPSRAGRSHCPEEWSEKHQLAQGAAVLFEAVRRLDQTSETSRTLSGDCGSSR